MKFFLRTAPVVSVIAPLLAKDGTIEVETTLNLSKEAWQRIEHSETLWILGYVDYVDQLRDKRRGRYARECVLGSQNVVSFKFEKHAGYNYDYTREKGQSEDVS